MTTPQEKQAGFWQKFAENNPNTAKYSAYAAACSGLVATGAAAVMGVPMILAEGASLSSIATGFATGAGIGLQLSAAILAPIGVLIAGAEHVTRKNKQDRQEAQSAKRKKSMANSMRQALRDKSWQPNAWRKFRQKMPMTSRIVKYTAIGIASFGVATLAFGGGAKALVAMRSAAAIGLRFVVPLVIVSAVGDVLVSQVKRAKNTDEDRVRKSNKNNTKGPSSEMKNEPKPSHKTKQNFQNDASLRQDFSDKQQKAPAFSEKGPKLSLKPKKNAPKL